MLLLIVKYVLNKYVSGQLRVGHIAGITLFAKLSLMKTVKTVTDYMPFIFTWLKPGVNDILLMLSHPKVTEYKNTLITVDRD